MKRRLKTSLWPAAVPLFGVATVLVYVAGLTGPFRVALALAFLGFGPGLALVRLLGPMDAFAIATLALAISIAVDTAVSTVLVYSGLWSPIAGLLVVVLLVVGAAAVETWQQRASRGTLS